MRSGFSAGLMGIGWILISFGAVIAVLYVLARQGGDTGQDLPAMVTVGAGSLIVGAVLFAAGFLLRRLHRNQPART